MRREHWLCLTILGLLVGGLGGPAQAGPQDKPLPSFLAPPPPHMPIGVPGTTVGPQITLPPGTTIVVPPAPPQPAVSASILSSSGGCADCQRPQLGPGRDGKWYPGQRICDAFTRYYYNQFEPRCGTDGCLMPIGCSNLYLEWIFAFGSCRQYHGAGTAAPPFFVNPPAKP